MDWAACVYFPVLPSTARRWAHRYCRVEFPLYNKRIPPSLYLVCTRVYTLRAFNFSVNYRSGGMDTSDSFIRSFRSTQSTQYGTSARKSSVCAPQRAQTDSGWGVSNRSAHFLWGEKIGV